MKNAKNVNLSLRVKAIALTLILSVLGFSTLIKPVDAYAEQADEIYYCDEVEYFDEEDDETSFNGEGGQVSASYTVECDYFVKTEEYVLDSAPSYGTTEFTNGCAAVAGANIIAYYDRWYTNLIPNFTPGMMNTLSNGTQVFRYFPDMGTQATSTLMTTLYQLMGSSATNGTTANQFRNGMQSYVSGKGLSISYESCYQSATMVNLSKIRQAVQSSKVCLVMCSAYNFVYGISGTTTGATIAKTNSNRGHMMLVYGYTVVTYYNDDVAFRSDTFLYASSGYQGGEQGYMQLNEYSTIEEAYVVTIQ